MSDHNAPAEDTALLAELRAAPPPHDPLPASLLDAARAAFGWRTIDAELAALVYDSTEDARALVGVRGLGDVRELTFQAGPVTVELEVIEVGRRRRLVGQIVPPTAGDVEVRQAVGSRGATVDELGRFLVEEVAPGPTSLRISLDLADGPRRVDTDWTVL